MYYPRGDTPQWSAAANSLGEALVWANRPTSISWGSPHLHELLLWASSCICRDLQRFSLWILAPWWPWHHPSSCSCFTTSKFWVAYCPVSISCLPTACPSHVPRDLGCATHIISGYSRASGGAPWFYQAQLCWHLLHNYSSLCLFCSSDFQWVM